MLSYHKFKIIRVVFKNSFAAQEMWPAGSKKWFFSDKGIDQTFYNKGNKTCLGAANIDFKHLNLINASINSLNPLWKWDNYYKLLSNFKFRKKAKTHWWKNPIFSVAER